jgi:hypothetical protein
MFQGVKAQVPARIVLSLALAACGAGAAEAQSTYVGASVLAEVTRFGSNGLSDSAGGEAFGGAIRVGTAITDRWGIDLEFTRPGEIEEENPFAYLAGGFESTLLEITRGLTVPGAGMPRGAGTISALSVPFSATTTRRFSTFTVMPYVRQTLGSRADVLYLGGIAFVRTTSRMDFSGGLRFIALPADTTWVNYSAAPAVGVALRARMTDNVKLVPGVRMLAIDDAGRTGWVIRPSIGLQWAF